MTSFMTGGKLGNHNQTTLCRNGVLGLTGWGGDQIRTKCGGAKVDSKPRTPPKKLGPMKGIRGPSGKGGRETRDTRVKGCGG